jgi:predicted outer membrane lipoprotein
MNEIRKTDVNENELVEYANRRIRIKRELYNHIFAYVVVNGFFIFVYFYSQRLGFEILGVPWFAWILGGWGLGVAFNIFNVVQDLNFKYNANAINKELDKMKKNK